MSRKQFQPREEMKLTQLVKPLFIVFILFLSQSCFILMGKSLGRVAAMRSIPSQGIGWSVRNKMLVTLDYIDGCGCYSDDDCHNTPGCGNYCLRSAVIGICRQSGSAS